MDKHMESVKQREDQADEEIKKLREKCVPNIEMDQEQEMDKLMQNSKQREDPQQCDWDGEQEKLAQKREEIKQERALLQEQKALEELKCQQQPDESDASA